MNFYVGDPPWLDILNGISAVVVALSAALAAYFAARGLTAWRNELSGRRRYELAEETLLAMRELAGIVAFMRSPISTGIEQAEFTQIQGENDEDFRIRVNYSTAYMRYQKHSEFFAKLRALGFRAGVLIDSEHEMPIRDALDIVDNVLQAGTWAMHFARQHKDQMQRYEAGLPPRANEPLWAERLHEKEKIYWSVEANDEINTRLKEVIKRAEIMYRPILKG